MGIEFVNHDLFNVVQIKLENIMTENLNVLDS